MLTSSAPWKSTSRIILCHFNWKLSSIWQNKAEQSQRHLQLCVSVQDGKDYIPLTAGEEAEGNPVTPDARSIYYRPQSGDVLEAQLHYDSPPALGSGSHFTHHRIGLLRWESNVLTCVSFRSSQQAERCSRPLSVKTFEDIPVAHSSVMVSRDPRLSPWTDSLRRNITWIHLKLLNMWRRAVSHQWRSLLWSFVCPELSTSICFMFYYVNQPRFLMPLQEGHIEPGIGFSPEDAKAINRHLPNTPNLR